MFYYHDLNHEKSFSEHYVSCSQAVHRDKENQCRTTHQITLRTSEILFRTYSCSIMKVLMMSLTPSSDCSVVVTTGGDAMSSCVRGELVSTLVQLISVHQYSLHQYVSTVSTLVQLIHKYSFISVRQYSQYISKVLYQYVSTVQ